MNIASYTGLPYDFRRRNCWTHVQDVRRDAGLETPTFDVKYPTQIDEAFNAGHADPKGLTQVDAPENYDAVLMGLHHGNRIVWHAGVYYDSLISHCELSARQVRLEPLADIKERYPEIQFWRG